MDPRPCDRAECAPTGCTVTAALRQHVDAYRQRYAPTPHQDRVLDWLCACQTSALGGRAISCAACGWSSVVYNSCRNRHCPQCRGGFRAEWLEARREQLLPVPHFQVVFTLPSRLREVAHDNPVVVYDLLFRAAVETLQTLAQQRLGGQLGVLAVLHTWTNDLRFHPHVHLLVTAGALRTDLGAWVPTRDDYLFPGRVMAAVFRGKFTEALRAAHRAGRVYVRGPPEHAAVAFDAAVRTACHHRWVVHVEPPKGRPADQVAKYLARYVHGVALSNARMVAVTEHDVTFRTRTGPVTLAGHVFVVGVR